MMFMVIMKVDLSETVLYTISRLQHFAPIKHLVSEIRAKPEARGTRDRNVTSLNPIAGEP